MKKRTANFALYCTMVLCLALLGCSVVEFAKPEGPPPDAQIYAAYEAIQLKTSTSADVLATIGRAKNELVSQSKSVVVSAGEKKAGRKVWLTMVGFDENELVARRKYVLIADERPKRLFVEPWEGLSLDCQAVLDSKVLDEPYANENARRIAILKNILETTRKDVKEVAPDNKTIEVGGMMVNQAIEAALVKLDASPALAARLSDEFGLEFQHPSFNRGRLRLVIEGDIATIKLWLGSATQECIRKAPEKEPVLRSPSV